MNPDTDLLPICCCARYWRVPRVLFLELLFLRAVGDAIALDDIPKEYRPARLTWREKAHLSWHSGGVRNLDRVPPALAAHYLLKHRGV